MAQLEDLSVLEVDQAAAVTATQATITDSSGGTDTPKTFSDVLASQTQGNITDSSGATSAPRTFSLFAGTGFSNAQVATANKHAAVTADTLAEVKADIASIISSVNNNSAITATTLAAIKVDVAAIITALKNANLMAS